jgi:uncharacterized membrane protein YidH (DUF202 family)
MNQNEPQAERFEVHATAGDHFAWLRTRLALIAFGFTIVQVFQRLQSQAPSKPVLLPEAPRDFGLVLIGSGVIGIVIALLQYQMVIKYMRSGEFRVIAGIGEKGHKTPLITMSILLAVIGVVAFSIVLFRLS